MSGPWTTKDIPDLHGRQVVITGANSGIGFFTALELAGKGAHVTLAVRSVERGEAAAQDIRKRYPASAVRVLPLDLADLASINRFAVDYRQRGAPLDILINNAGVMNIPFRRTADGFEMQFGTNHLGHFALTGLLLPVLLSAPAARIVTVSSINHNFGRIDFDNLDGSKKYGGFPAYNQSKLANVLFAYELQRRLAAHGAKTISVACHPGYASTNLQSAGSRMTGSRLGLVFWSFANAIMAQPAEMGALPSLYAAVAPGVPGGSFVGPLGLGGIRGTPGVVRSNPRSYDMETARRLWQVSEALTGVTYPL
ncbi:MAG TPA: oxidoreductase [Anaerolineaceae bacterium]